MTLTEARPNEVQPSAPEPAPQGSWLTTADHKRIGRLYLAASLLFLVIAGVVGFVLRGELAEQGVSLVGDEYFRLFSLHATAGTLLFLAPVWTGLAAYLIPLQIGAARLAFPRLQATAFWLFLMGGGVVLASYLIGDGPAAGGITFSTPLLTGDREATDLWIAGLAMLTVSSVLSAANFLVTTMRLRTEGMTMGRVPAFTWSVFCASAVQLLSGPVFLGGLLLLYIDQHYGGTFFAEKGTDVVWQHLLWLYGRPDVYLLALPGLGVACEIVATHARRPLLSGPAVKAALGAFALLSITAWAAGNQVADAVVLPTYSPLTAAIALPVGVLALVWLGSLRFGTPRLHLSLAFVAGFLLLLLFGAANAGVAALRDGVGGAWANGNLHVVAFGAPLLLAVAAIHHWAPKIWGRPLGQGLGAVTFLALLGGFLFMGLGAYLMGYDGAPAHVEDLTDSGWINFARLAAAGGILVIVGVLALVANLVSAGRGRGEPAGDDPYEGLTLEWATTSPPPPHNFESVPEVRSDSPLLDLRNESGATA